MADSSSLADTKYDPLFKAYSEKYLPYDWHWTKAQAWQESRFDPRAVSPVGAQGLMQIMPRTAAELAIKTGIKGHVTNPKLNVLYGTYYMHRMMRIWTSKRTQCQRKLLATASYNSGAGNVIKAQAKCGMKSTWKDIKPCMPMVTGKHATETITYVKRIQQWDGQLNEQGMDMDNWQVGNSGDIKLAISYWCNACFSKSDICSTAQGDSR